MTAEISLKSVKSEYTDFADSVAFPQFRKNRLLYMHKIDIAKPELPEKYCDYLDTITQMLSNLPKQEGAAYVTIDEKALSKGECHRRPGIHVDYNWYEKITAHGDEPAKPSPGPDHDLQSGEEDHGNHKPPIRRKKPNEKGIHDMGVHGHRRALHPKGGMLMATNFLGCFVWPGTFSGTVLPGGDCSLIELFDNGLSPKPLVANRTFWLGALCIHEGTRMTQDIDRQLVRINLHPNYDISHAV